MVHGALKTLESEEYADYGFRSAFGAQLKEIGLTPVQVADVTGDADTRMAGTVYAPARHEGIMKNPPSYQAGQHAGQPSEPPFAILSAVRERTFKPSENKGNRGQKDRIGIAFVINQRFCTFEIAFSPRKRQAKTPSNLYGARGTGVLACPTTAWSMQFNGIPRCHAKGCGLVRARENLHLVSEYECGMTLFGNGCMADHCVPEHRQKF